MTVTADFGSIVGPQQEFYVEWKIKDFLAIWWLSGHRYTSPEFRLFNSVLRLSLICNYNTPPLWSVGLSLRFHFSIFHSPDPYPVYCVFGIKSRDGKTYESTGITQTFEGSYINTSISLTNSELNSNINILDPDGSATFYCRIRLPERKEIDVASQTSYHNDLSKDSKKNDDVGLIFDEEDIDILRQDISEMFAKEQNCDVVLKVGEQEFKAHKGILATRSQVFASMFEHDMIESKSGIVNIEDCDPDAFQDFLQYIYTAKVESVTTDKMLVLYSIADKYDVKELKNKCLKFLLQNPCVDRFGDTLALALKYDEKELIQSSEDFFTQNATDILVTVKWQLFMKENITVANELFIKYTLRRM